MFEANKHPNIKFAVLKLFFGFSSRAILNN